MEANIVSSEINDIISETDCFIYTHLQNAV